MYEAYQAHADWMWPLRTFARSTLPWLRDESLGLAKVDSHRKFAAMLEVIKLGEITHHRPPFGIDSVNVKGETLAVSEEDTHVTPFGTLLHFK
jgi:poly(3-hydroxybutyrate) depolymerase